MDILNSFNRKEWWGLSRQPNDNFTGTPSITTIDRSMFIIIIHVVYRPINITIPTIQINIKSIISVINNKIYIFFIRGSTCTAIAIYISSLPFPHFYHFLLARGPPLEMWPQTFPPMVYHIYTRAQEIKLRKTCADTAGHLTESVLQSPKKWPPAQGFDYAGRGPVVTHPSTDPPPSCLTWVTVWCRRTTTHRTLSVINNNNKNVKTNINVSQTELQLF